MDCDRPGTRHAVGLIGQKAILAGVTADCPSFFLLMLQIAELWARPLRHRRACSGCGDSEGTMTNMLSLPISRHWFIAAKLAVVFLWFGLLIAWLMVEGLMVCWYLELPGFTAAVIGTATRDILLTALGAALLSPGGCPSCPGRSRLSRTDRVCRLHDGRWALSSPQRVGGGGFRGQSSRSSPGWLGQGWMSWCPGASSPFC